MAAKAVPRDVTPLLTAIRNFLLGRKPINALRFPDYIAPRTQPPPNLPHGPHEKLSANYYYTRDGRREMKPAELVASNIGVKAIAAGESQSTAVATKKPVTPGKVFHWD